MQGSYDIINHNNVIIVYRAEIASFIVDEESEDAIMLKSRTRKAFGKIGNNSYVYNPFVISHPDKISIGNNVKILDNARISIYDVENTNESVVQIEDECYIGYNLSILALAKIHIGRKVLIASNVLITSQNHGINPESTEYYMDQALNGKEVYIGEGSWIGEKTCILPGVNIGKKCVIGAGSVVTKDIPDYCISAGNPAKIIKQYDFEQHKWKKVDKYDNC